MRLMGAVLVLIHELGGYFAKELSAPQLGRRYRLPNSDYTPCHNMPSDEDLYGGL
jgi:hypothetical protein